MDRDKLLKEQIFQKVREYYEKVHKDKEFVPGKSRIHYAGRVYDEQEMLNMVDIRKLLSEKLCVLKF